MEKDKYGGCGIERCHREIHIYPDPTHYRRKRTKPERSKGHENRPLEGLGRKVQS